MIEPVQQLAFGRGGNADRHLGGGWSGAEDNFRWMVGEASELWLDNPGADRGCILELDLAPFVRPPALPVQRLQLRVRNTLLGEAALSHGAILGFLLPPPLLVAPGPLRVELLHPDAARPSQLGDSSDERMLSLRLQTVRLWRLPDAATMPSANARAWHAATPAEVMRQFHSLGETAAFATVQAQAGHVPEDLFGFAHVALRPLLLALDAGFAGLGDPDRLRQLDAPAEPNIVLRDDVLGAHFNTGLTRQDTPSAALLPQQGQQIATRAAQLRETIRAGGAHFVLTRARPLPGCEVLPLYCRLNTSAANSLLWTMPADAAHPAGALQTLLAGLDRGYLTAPAAAGKAASVPEWLRLCRTVLSGEDPGDGDAIGAPAIIGSAAPARRTVVFLGNCQLETLAALYRGLLPTESDEHVVYVPSYREADATQQRAVAEASVVLRQVLDFTPQIGDLPTRGVVHLVPHITGAFLWPNFGDAHPRNAPEPHLDASGPYPPELGDQLLNRMIAQAVPANEAVRRYRDTDLAATRRVDRLLELFLDRLRKRDAVCGFAFADHIATRFRQECLFRSPNHPDTGLALDFAAAVFSRMGVPDAAIAQLRATPPETIFPPSEAPIHPSVVAHFGLDYPTTQRGYRYFNEGRFSFEEFAGRYMRYEWNRALAEGLHLLRQRQIEAGVAALLEALPTAPRSARGRIALANALERLGRVAEAARYAAEAAALEPDEARFVRRAAELAAQAGR